MAKNTYYEPLFICTMARLLGSDIISAPWVMDGISTSNIVFKKWLYIQMFTNVRLVVILLKATVISNDVQ